MVHEKTAMPVQDPPNRQLKEGLILNGHSFSPCLLLLGATLPLPPALYSPLGLSAGKFTLLKQLSRQLKLRTNAATAQCCKPLTFVLLPLFL